MIKLNFFDYNKEVDQNNFKALQISLVVLSTIYYLWAYVMKYLAPHGFEEGRFLPCASLILLAVGVNWTSEKSFLRRHFHLFAVLGLCWIVMHFTWLVTKNPSDTFHIISFMIIIMIATIVQTHNYQVLLFSTVAAMCGAVVTFTQTTSMLSMECFLLILTIIQIGIIVTFLKIKLIEDKNTAILQEKRAKEQLMNSSKMALLGELSSGLGHEINNPLMIISNELQILFLKENDQDTDTILTRIEEQVFRIGKITHILKSFSDNQKSVKHMFSLNHSINNSIQLIESKAKKENVNINFNSNEIKSFGREQEIGQILVNLLSNSIDAVALRDDKQIYIEASQDNDNAYIKVIDNGHGISETVAKKLFDPFFTTKDPNKGTGVGLTISKQLAEKNESDLYLDKDSKGTCFTLKIPKSTLRDAQAS